MTEKKAARTEQEARSLATRKEELKASVRDLEVRLEENSEKRGRERERDGVRREKEQWRRTHAGHAGQDLRARRA